MLIKKIHILFLLLVSGISFLHAQSNTYSKAHGDSLISPNYAVDSKKEAEDAVEHIVEYTGLTQNFQIVENPAIKNANAYIKHKQRYIAYNPQFMLRVKDRTKSDWGAISVIAHEIGHHLSGHTLVKRSHNHQAENHQEELDADRFSGFILYKMGATLDEAKLAINNVELNSNPETHPEKEMRLIAIAQGWLQANRLEERFSTSDTTSKNLFASPSPAADPLHKKKSLYIYKCMIYGDKNYYFVDEKNQIVSIDNNLEPIVVGYKVKSQDPSFDWIFSVQSLTYGVDSKGRMWNKTYSGDMFVVGRVYNIKD